MPGLFGSKFHRSEDSFAIRLSGWTKLGMCTAVSVVTLFLKHEPALMILLAAGAVFAFSQLKLRIILFLYLAIGVMSALSVGFASLLGRLASNIHPAFTGYNAFVMLLPFMRVIAVMQVLVVTALSTSPQEILTNLKSIRLPRFLYLPVLVMLRFVPSFINDMKQINESLKVRGLRVNLLTLITRPGLTIRCSVIPLIFRAFRSSDELAVASELKGVGYLKKTTSFRPNRMGRIDVVMILVSVLLLTSSLYLQSLAPPEESMMHGRMGYNTEVKISPSPGQEV